MSHFVAECPYEKREDNGGKLIRKDKAKSFPNKSNFTKKTPHKALVVQEEYHEDDDDDEDGDEIESDLTKVTSWILDEQSRMVRVS